MPKKAGFEHCAQIFSVSKERREKQSAQR